MIGIQMDINWPESLYVDYPREGASSSSSDNRTQGNTTQSFSAANLHEIKQFIEFINLPHTRAEAIKHLSGIQSINEELALAYKKLSPPRLDMEETTRVCNAIGLLQACIASHPEARMGFIKGIFHEKAHIHIYIYPFLYTTEKQLLQLDYLRTNSLNVIGMLLKESPNATEIVLFLLESEMVPLCIRCMDVGCEMTKTAATFVLAKILDQPEGKIYTGSFAERFFAVTKRLSKMVDEFSGKPPALLLNNILICYFYLSKIPGGCDALRKRYPWRLRDPVYLNYACDASTRRIADEMWHHIMTVQLPPVPLENQFSGMRL